MGLDERGGAGLFKDVSQKFCLKFGERFQLKDLKMGCAQAVTKNSH